MPNASNLTAVPSESATPLRRGHRFYQGERGPSGCHVWVTEASGARVLPGRTRKPLASYAWGRPGLTTQELAWAVLFDTTDDPQIADDWYVDFSSAVITRLPRESFCLAAQDVLAWLGDPVLDSRPQLHRAS